MLSRILHNLWLMVIMVHVGGIVRCTQSHRISNIRDEIVLKKWIENKILSSYLSLIINETERELNKNCAVKIHGTDPRLSSWHKYCFWETKGLVNKIP